MKKKKLVLNKKTIAHLGNAEMSVAKAGRTIIFYETEFCSILIYHYTCYCSLPEGGCPKFP